MPPPIKMTQTIFDAKPKNTELAQTRRPIREISEVDGTYYFQNDVRINLGSHCMGVEYLLSCLPYKTGDTVPIEIDGELNGWVLEITDVRAEWLQDISDKDCFKEGLEHFTRIDYKTHMANMLGGIMTPQECYQEYIWNTLPYKPPYDWNSNPLVAVYTGYIKEVE